MSSTLRFLIRRIKSIGYACKGAYLLISTEASVKVQFIVGVIVTLAGIYYKLSATEWIIQTLVIALIMAIEGLNTAIEEIADFVQPEHDERIGLVKDLAAGAVFIIAVAAVIVGGIIYLPKMF